MGTRLAERKATSTTHIARASRLSTRLCANLLAHSGWTAQAAIAACAGCAADHQSPAMRILDERPVRPATLVLPPGGGRHELGPSPTKIRRAADAVRCGRGRLRPSAERAIRTRASCWSANNPGRTKTSPGVPSSGLRDVSSIARSRTPDWSRESVYLTNAVKHFKWEPRGKRRMHKTPGQREIEACHVWLEQEIGTLYARV